METTEIDTAISLLFISAINKLALDIADRSGYHFIRGIDSNGNPNLIMSDVTSQEYYVDALLASESVQPLILFAWKYNRHKKHNRDKASWVCSAHPAIRRRYASIRSSIAVLAGSWSSSSIAMMKSNHINIFLIPFERICEILDGYGVDFRWDEKDRQKSAVAWKVFYALSNSKKAQIGVEMVNTIKTDLENLILSILDDSTEREIEDEEDVTV